MQRAHFKAQDTRAAWLMLAPFLVFFILFIAYPMGMSVYYSFTDYNLNTANLVGLRNYERLTRDPVFGMAFVNTCVYALVSVTLLFFLGFLTAAVLNRSFRGVAGLRMLMLYPYATSMTAVSMIFLMLFDVNNGVFNKILRMMGAQQSHWLFDPAIALYCLIFVNVWKNIGYCMLIYLSGMQTIDHALYEAATVDGAGEWSRLVHITLPMIRPVALFVLITTMVDAFKTFEQVQIMTHGDPLYATTTIVHQIYQQGFSDFRMGYASAMAVVLLVVVMAFSGVGLRFNKTYV